MNKPVSEANDAMLRNFGVSLFKIMGELIGGFTNDFKITLNGFKGAAVGHKTSKVKAMSVCPDFGDSDQHVVEQELRVSLDIDQVGFDGRKISGFDSVSRYQINPKMKVAFEFVS